MVKMNEYFNYGQDHLTPEKALKIARKEIIGIIDNCIKGHFSGIDVLGSDREADVMHDKYGEYPVVLVPDLPDARKNLALGACRSRRYCGLA